MRNSLLWLVIGIVLGSAVSILGLSTFEWASPGHKAKFAEHADLQQAARIIQQYFEAVVSDDPSRASQYLHGEARRRYEAALGGQGISPAAQFLHVGVEWLARSDDVAVAEVVATATLGSGPYGNVDAQAALVYVMATEDGWRIVKTRAMPLPYEGESPARADSKAVAQRFVTALQDEEYALASNLLTGQVRNNAAAFFGAMQTAARLGDASAVSYHITGAGPVSWVHVRGGDRELLLEVREVADRTVISDIVVGSGGLE